MINDRIALKLPIFLFLLTILSAIVTGLLNFRLIDGWITELTYDHGLDPVIADSFRQDVIVNFTAIAQSATLAFLFIVTLIIRKMIGPLSELQNQLMRVADEKDLSFRVKVGTNCEIGQSAAASNRLLEVFEEFVAISSQEAKQMEAMANSLAESSIDLTNDAHTRSGSVTQLSAVLTQTADQAALAVEAARQVGSSITGARTSALDGKKQMDEMVRVVTEIADTAQDLSKIMETINDIAFQTNILALNANVEAARAGANGKGFAVVANEVGMLAKRSSEAAKRSAELIEQSLARTSQGRDAAGRSREAFDQIVQNVETADNDIKRIDEVIDDQKKSVDEAYTTSNLIASTSVNDMTQTDTINRAANQLREQSQSVRLRLEQFKSSAA